jgi:hypothetical protein
MRRLRHVYHWPRLVAVALLFGATSLESTTFIVYRTSAKIVVGADGLGLIDTPKGLAGIPFCKIRKTRSTYVVMSGFISEPRTAYSAYTVAAKAIRNSEGVVAAAQRFIKLNIGPFHRAADIMRNRNPKLYRNYVMRGPEQLTAFFIGVENSVPTLAGVHFKIAEVFDKEITVTPILHTCPGELCPPISLPPPAKGEGIVFSEVGEHTELDDMIAHPSFSAHFLDDPVAAIRYGIEIEIKAHPDLVGPPISILTLSKDGETWNQQGECK